MSSIDRAVALADTGRIVEAVKNELQCSCKRGEVRLPERYLTPLEDCYARRLLHRNPDAGYTVVVMTWGPGQQTPLHDHAGIWCVECVVQGRLYVTQYDVEQEREGRFRFREHRRVGAGVGDAGCLIPPFEYHVLSNALADDTTITMHVYGGEMDHCNLFTPRRDGWWDRSERHLVYHD
jgi:predicted metal-dependent enzyme (double-stranded beta helix superfamily)